MTKVNAESANEEAALSAKPAKTFREVYEDLSFTFHQIRQLTEVLDDITWQMSREHSKEITLVNVIKTKLEEIDPQLDDLWKVGTKQ